MYIAIKDYPHTTEKNLILSSPGFITLVTFKIRIRLKSVKTNLAVTANINLFIPFFLLPVQVCLLLPAARAP